jgi:mono/diheme cytochrome c family protein
MFRCFVVLLAVSSLAMVAPADPWLILHSARSSPGDLEVGGELIGQAPGATRYIRYDDLLRLPQETYTVTDDSNFKRRIEIRGVALGTLARLLGQSADMIVAICYDHYRTNYPADYLAIHHPILVLRIDGELRDRWPKAEDGGSLGPYLISHPFFKPAFKVLAHDDEPQVPYGVTRIEFRRESQVFGAIRPPGNWPPDSLVEQGFVIARQDCFRCHNMGRQGGTMAGRSWVRLAAMAGSNGARFRQIIRNPGAITPGARGPAHADYDDVTLDALTAYFKTFARPDSARPRSDPQP